MRAPIARVGRWPRLSCPVHHRASRTRSVGGLGRRPVPPGVPGSGPRTRVGAAGQHPTKCRTTLGRRGRFGTHDSLSPGGEYAGAPSCHERARCGARERAPAWARTPHRSGATTSIPLQIVCSRRSDRKMSRILCQVSVGCAATRGISSVSAPTPPEPGRGAVFTESDSVRLAGVDYFRTPGGDTEQTRSATLSRQAGDRRGGGSGVGRVSSMPNTEPTRRRALPYSCSHGSPALLVRSAVSRFWPLCVSRP